MNFPILLFGMPRSGTTWVGKLFDSHPDTLYRHEPDSVLRLSMPMFPNLEAAPGYRKELEQFVSLAPGLRSPEVVGKQPLFPKSYQSDIGLLAYRASVIGAKIGSRISRHFPCLYRPTAEASNRAHLVWKSIESPGRLGACIEALPEARAIHLMRHPCGYIASILRGEAARRFSGEYTDDLWMLKMLLETPIAKRHHISVEDLEELAPEERLAWRWVLIQEKILADVGNSERVLTLRYEDICSDPLGMTREMFKFVALDWHPQTEAFVRASTESTRADYYSVFKDPRNSAERWRSELPSQTIDRVLDILRCSSAAKLYPEHMPAIEMKGGAGS